MDERVEDDPRWSELGTAILDNLDDDEPRLKAAQELTREEPASQRAYFIRLQVRLASLEGGMDHPEWFRLAAEARRLTLELQHTWVPQIARSLEPSELVFHRGFLEGVALDVRALLGSFGRSDLVRLADRTAIRHLTLYEVRPDGDLYAAVKVVHEAGLVRRLRSLQVDGQRIDDRSVEAITGIEWPNLRWLSLRHNQIGFQGVRRLLEESTPDGRLSQLRFVRLDGNLVDPVERVQEDQGVVVQTTIPEVQRELPPARWLRRVVQGGRLVEPDRYEHRSVSIGRG